MIRDPGPSLIQAARYIELFRDRCVVVKLGGELQTTESLLDPIIPQLEVLARCGLRPVVVHGGGTQIDERCKKRGLDSPKVAGRRITSKAVMEVVLEVVAGELNGAICQRLRDRHVPVVGFADGASRAIRCRRRPPVVIDGQTVDFGEVGDIVSIDPDPLRPPAGAPWAIPILPSIGVLDDGSFVNVNADTVAARTAVALGAHKLVMLSRVAGVLTSPQAAGPISQLDAVGARRLIEQGQVVGGMRAKVEEALAALAGGVPQVHVISGVEAHTLLREIFTEEGCGTLITRGSGA